MKLVIISLIACIGCAQVKASLDATDSYQDRLRATQHKLFAKHKAILVAEGRMPLEFFDEYLVLGQYGWHSSRGGGQLSVGAAMTVLAPSFGMYSFHPAAFEQAKRSWWIDGVMESGSDILVPVNHGARFTTRCDVWATSTNGVTTEYSPPCVNTMNSPVGHRVDYIWDGEGDGLRDATVIELVKYPDGSSTGHLRLNKKARHFALTYGIGILPPDYVDMCACKMSGGTQ